MPHADRTSLGLRPGDTCARVFSATPGVAANKRAGGARLTQRIGIRSIIRNGALLAGSNWVEIALRTLYVVAITRFLGAELYGVWAYAAAAYGLAIGLVGFGFDTLLSIRLGTEKRDAARFVDIMLALRLGLLGLAGVGVAVYALAAEPAGIVRVTLLLTIPALLGRGLALWARALFVAYERVGIYVRMAAVLRLAEVATGVALLAAGGGLIAIVLVHAAAWLAEGAIGLRMAQRRLMPCRPRLPLGEAGELLRQGAVLGLAASFATWLTAGPLILLRHTGGDLTSLGQLALALQLTMIGVSTAQPFLAAALPVLSRSVAREDSRVTFYGAWTALASLLVFGGLAGLGHLVGPLLIVFVFGPDFALAGELLGPCLLIGGLIIAPTGYGQVLVVKGWRWPGAVAGAIGGMILLFALPPAVAQWGTYGAVFAAIAAWLVRGVILIACAPARSRAV